jgi:hypothetical protein
MIYEIHLYSINGKLVSREQLAYPVQDMIIKNEYCILAVIVNSNNRNQIVNRSLQTPETPFINSTSSHVSKIIIKEILKYKNLISILV